MRGTLLAGALCALALLITPSAASAASCDVSGQEATFGPTAVTSVSATRLPCGKALTVVKAYQACRMANGVSGRCVKKVKGYACREVRQSGPTSFTATVTCTKGTKPKKRKTVKHSYTQDVM